MVKEELQRAKQALEADAPATTQSPPADAGAGGAIANKAQQRAKKADSYHARHVEWVAQFNELTGGECAGGDSGVKWVAVRAWQQKHWQLNNLLADGLVGPKTLEAAKLLSKKNAPKSEKGSREKEVDPKEGGAEDRAAEKTHDSGGGDKRDAAAEQPGQADGAEAAADKPKLEDDVDEQVAPAAQPAGAAASLADKKRTTLAEFDSAVAKLEAILAQHKQPQGEGPQKPIAQHYVEGTDDAEAPPALGNMMSKEVLKGYNETAQKLRTSWSELGQPHARAQFLLDAVNEALAAEKVPPIMHVKLEKLPNPGKFIPSDWIMAMNAPIFATSTAPKNTGEIASEVFHEGRHAEQRFGIARLIATQQPHADAKKIAKAAGVLPAVAAKAVELRTQPLSPEQQAKVEEFKHATVDNPAHKEIEESAAGITDAANAAAAVFRALSPEDQAIASARWQDVRQLAITGLEAYYHLATERDAYAAQKQLESASK